MHLLVHLSFLLLTTLPVHLNADDYSYQPFLFPATTPATTIPAFPEQSDITGSCLLDLPDALFTSISHSCSSRTPSRFRCCPTLAAWLYSAYSSSALSLHLPSSSADLPVLPDDSESCLGGVEKALAARGVALGNVNESCDVVWCYCGVRLRPLNCPGGLRVAKEEGRWVAKDDTARRVARECAGSGVSGCNRCLRSLYQVKEAAAGGNGTTSSGTGGVARRKKNSRQKHDRDCHLMGLTWLLAKNRTLYLPTAIKILRAFMMTPDGQDPLSCTLARDGMPLPVDSSEFTDDASSSPFATVGSSLSSHYVRWISIFCTVFVLFFSGLV